MQEKQIQSEDNKVHTNPIKVWKERHFFRNFFYLIFPIAAAFGGFFLSCPVWNLIKKGEGSPTPEAFSFIFSLIFFLLAATFVFLKTRKITAFFRNR